MKKSEKVKGKEAVAARKKKLTQYAIGIVVVMVVAAAIAFYFFNPYFVKSGDTVAIYFTGTLDNGTVVESNLNSTPFVFTIGKNEIMPYGLPDTVIGMQQNETKTVVLPPEKAFGLYQTSLIQVVNRSSLPSNTTFVVGQDYQIVRKYDNAIAHVKIINVTPSTIAWDGNHDLAGQNLTLKVTLVRIVRE
ncbi:MAG: FKBP-type peptidyl-prolyl cis-trans isomerase [Methanoregula sp.]|nr:FKBP-type peptidyl-prolyl cis-trans isomerase [Methanoregula sp.]